MRTMESPFLGIMNLEIDFKVLGFSCCPIICGYSVDRVNIAKHMKTVWELRLKFDL